MCLNTRAFVVSPRRVSFLFKKMVKKNKNKKTKMVKRANRQAVPKMGLDSAGIAYARLLSDPCHAPMAHPTYSGTEGGYLVRCDQFVTLNEGATDTAGYFHWTPSLINNASVLWKATTSGSAASTPSLGGSAINPGQTFLESTASVARCVAACLKVTYNGAENTRAGRVHYGQVSGGYVTSASSVSPNEFAMALPSFERTPAGVIELLWKPNDADQLFSKPGSANADDSAKNNKAASLSFCWSGLPAATGLNFHLTAVWEWQPQFGDGIANPNLSKSPSQNTLDEVINYLIRSGERFVRSTAMAATRQITNVGLSAAYGLMSHMATRSPGLIGG